MVDGLVLARYRTCIPYLNIKKTGVEPPLKSVKLFDHLPQDLLVVLPETGDLEGVIVEHPGDLLKPRGLL